jgi:hypothetical protein
MNKTYNRKQAMERLGVKSTKAFTQMTKKYPESFVVLVPGNSKFPRFDKHALDKFASLRDALKQQIHFSSRPW